MNPLPPEIDWRGRLYIGPVQLLGNAERDEPQPEDQFPTTKATILSGFCRLLRLGGNRTCLQPSAAHVGRINVCLTRGGSGSGPTIFACTFELEFEGKDLKSLIGDMGLAGLGRYGFFCLQEVGGLSATQGPFDRSELGLSCFLLHPLRGFRALAIGIPTHLAPFVERVIPMTAAMMVVIQQAGSRTFVFSTHLPHAQRPDCLQVWSEFVAQMDEHLLGIRYHDVVLGGGDLNVDARGEVDTYEWVVHVQDLLLNHAMGLTAPSQATWYNSRGAESKIDFAFYRAPRARLLHDLVVDGPEDILQTDHRPVVIVMSSV